MILTPENQQQRIEDCREIYLRHNGQHHELIEREMRAMGHAGFHRRSMYRRFERGTCKAGWIERYGWERLLKSRNADCGLSSTAETRRRGEAKGNGPQINADDTDKAGPEDHLFDLDLDLDPDLRHLRSSAAKTLPQRLGGSAVPSPVEPQLEDFDEFKQWLKAVSPTMEWEWKHQVYIYRRLKRVSDGICKRLMIFLPPRHGKSELVTVRYAAYRLKQDPTLNVILGSYNQRLANRFSRKVRRVLTDDHSLTAETQRRGEEKENWPQINADSADMKTADLNCPDPRHLRPSAAKSLPRRLCDSAVDKTSPFPFISQRPKNSEAEWETSQGGGLRAVGVGSGVTGFGANLIIIDDPVKSRAEAESLTYRERLWDWFNDDLYTRLEPDGSIILIQTRWHEDDLAGRLLREAAEEGGEQWEVVSLPALAESTSTAEPQRRGEEAENWPQINADSTDADMKTAEIDLSDPRHLRPSAAKTLPRRISDSAVQLPDDPLGRQPGEALCPERYDEEALERLRKKLGSYSFASLYQQRPVPAEGGLFKREWFKNIISAAPFGLRWCRGYDLAMSSSAASDYTASLRVAFDREGNMYIDGGFRRRIEYPEQRKFILGRIRDERDTTHGVELSANGNAVMQDLRRDRNLLGRAFRGIKPEGTKISRALGWLAIAEEGKLFLVRGAWNTEFIDEACSFPSGTHDDQIDAVSIAVRMCRSRAKRAFGF